MYKFENLFELLLQTLYPFLCLPKSYFIVLGLVKISVEFVNGQYQLHSFKMAVL